MAICFAPRSSLPSLPILLRVVIMLQQAFENSLECSLEYAKVGAEMSLGVAQRGRNDERSDCVISI